MAVKQIIFQLFYDFILSFIKIHYNIILNIFKIIFYRLHFLVLGHSLFV